MRLLLKRPTYLLSLLWLACFGVCIATAWFAAKQPSIGVPFVVRAQQIHVGDIVNEATSDIQSDAKVMWLQAAGMERIELKPTELIEEPDFFDTYVETEAFFARQSTLFKLLHAPEVRIVWQDAAGQQHDSMVRPGPRALSGLPFVFWFQLFVVTSMYMISTAVFAVRPEDWVRGAGLGVLIHDMENEIHEYSHEKRAKQESCPQSKTLGVKCAAKGNIDDQRYHDGCDEFYARISLRQFEQGDFEFVFVRGIEQIDQVHVYRLGLKVAAILAGNKGVGGGRMRAFKNKATPCYLPQISPCSSGRSPCSRTSPSSSATATVTA